MPAWQWPISFGKSRTLSLAGPKLFFRYPREAGAKTCRHPILRQLTLVGYGQQGNQTAPALLAPLSWARFLGPLRRFFLSLQGCGSRRSTPVPMSCRAALEAPQGMARGGARSSVSLRPGGSRSLQASAHIPRCTRSALDGAHSGFFVSFPPSSHAGALTPAKLAERERARRPRGSPRPPRFMKVMLSLSCAGRLAGVLNSASRDGGAHGRADPQ